MNTLKERHPNVLFVVNGGIWNYEQHEYFTKKCGADGTMAATFLLANPFLYGPFHADESVSAEEPATLRWKRPEELAEMFAAARRAQGHEEIMQQIVDQRHGLSLRKTKYTYNPALSEREKITSLSTDVLNKIIRESANT